MTSRFVFDSVWEVYRAIRVGLKKSGGLRAINVSKPAGRSNFCPSPRAQLKEFCSDFALVGRRALADPHLASRRILFDNYYVGLAEYETARHFLGVSEMTWVVWTEEIRDLVGQELKSVGLFPVRDYFCEPSRARQS